MGAPSAAPASSGPADVYLMRMYTERLQILVSKDQRRRLEREAKRRNSSVASVIRDAVDAELGRRSRQDKLEAVEAIRRMPKMPEMSVEDLLRLIKEARDEQFTPGLDDLLRE
jgi:hypothetical protein